MPKKRSWTDYQLKIAVKKSKSYRQVISELGLIPAGGNYDQVKKRIGVLELASDHFMGSAWNKGLRYELNNKVNIEALLVEDSAVQSYKLKNRLFRAGIKMPSCELCGWRKKSTDGRIPVELDHINGNSKDNRIENLRILCPNCHSLQMTHRGKNKRVALDGRVLK